MLSGKGLSVAHSPYNILHVIQVIVRLMNKIMEGWQEMEGKDKVVCVVDKACENGRV